MRVLLTGFEPFGKHKENSSWTTASKVVAFGVSGVDITLRQLPVSFIQAGKIIRDNLKMCNPDVLVMLGLRGSAKSVDIERIAVNMMDSAKPDNEGYCPQELQIVADGKTAYFSNLPVKVLRDALLMKNLSAKVSNSAGLYVCNCTYYNALNEIYECHLPTKAVFVHLPDLSPDFPVELLAESVKTIIETIRDMFIQNN